MGEVDVRGGTANSYISVQHWASLPKPGTCLTTPPPPHRIVHVARHDAHYDHDFAGDTVAGAPPGEAVPSAEGLQWCWYGLHEVAQCGQDLESVKVGGRRYHRLKGCSGAGTGSMR